MIFHKCHGAGNDFLVADNRDGHIRLDSGAVRRLCDRHTGFGADGLMLLEGSGMHDFRMVFYNPDGSTGMMCGNGGRCIVAFAALLGLGHFTFEAADGLHEASVVSRDGDRFVIRLKMKEVSRIDEYGDGCFLDTGTRHFVRFVDDVEKTDVASLGPRLRHDSRFAPQGTNVNFVSRDASSIRVRTFEKGVEGETLACGTGIVASAIASWYKGVYVESEAPGRASSESAPVTVPVRARIAPLTVSFSSCGGEFRDIWLEGPAEFVGTVDASESMFI